MTSEETKLHTPMPTMHFVKGIPLYPLQVLSDVAVDDTITLFSRDLNRTHVFHAENENEAVEKEVPLFLELAFGSYLTSGRSVPIASAPIPGEIMIQIPDELWEKVQKHNYYVSYPDHDGKDVLEISETETVFGDYAVPLPSWKEPWSGVMTIGGHRFNLVKRIPFTEPEYYVNGIRVIQFGYKQAMQIASHILPTTREDLKMIVLRGTEWHFQQSIKRWREPAVKEIPAKVMKPLIPSALFGKLMKKL